MSYSTDNSSSATGQKFCKVCKDAGKSAEEYSSHFVRENANPSSTVVCPTLLALNCSYCTKFGHTVKYCPLLKEKAKNDKHRAATICYNKSVTEKSKNAPKNNVSRNAFAGLDSDSDEEEEQPKVKEQFPALDSTRANNTIGSSLNYAAALTNAAPKVQPSVQVQVQPKVQAQPKVQPKVQAQVKVAPWVTSGKISTRLDWAAHIDSDTDSDIDDDDEEFV